MLRHTRKSHGLRPFFCPFVCAVALATGVACGGKHGETASDGADNRMTSTTAPAKPAAKEGRLRVYVSIPPEMEFVQRVGGERIVVQSLIGRGQNPHTFQITPREMDNLAGTIVYFAIGVPFEAVWHERLAEANPGMKIIDLSDGLKKISMLPPSRRAAVAASPTPAPQTPAPTRSMQSHAEHGDEGEADPHTWMNPNNAMQMIAKVRDVLSEADPAGRATYEANFQQYRDELMMADRRIRMMLENLPTRKFLIYHPALGYFAQAYDLEQLPVEIEGKSPTARELTETIQEAKSSGVRVLFVEPQFNPRSAQTIADALNVKPQMVNDLAPDYLVNLTKIAQALADAYKNEGRSRGAR